MIPIEASTIDRLTDLAVAALPSITAKEAILVVYNRAGAAWRLVIGPPARAQLGDLDEAVLLHADVEMSRDEVRSCVEKTMADVVGLVSRP